MGDLTAVALIARNKISRDIDSPAVSTWELLRDLPLEIESHALEGHELKFSPEFTRLTTVIRFKGGGQEGAGEDVVYDALDHIALRERCTKRHVANTISLAFLAPDLVRAVIEARLPRGISTKRIAEPELEWSRQWERLGIRA